MKATITAIVVAIVLIGGALIFTGSGARSDQGDVGNIGGVPNLGGISDTGNTSGASNVSIVDGKQIIEIRAKGGYQPRKSIAKAGVPTIIRFNTSGTFDCSSYVRIPSLNISKALPQTGSTDIDIGSPKLGTLQGTCGMGMYPFEVSFQ